MKSNERSERKLNINLNEKAAEDNEQVGIPEKKKHDGGRGSGTVQVVEIAAGER